MAINAEPELFEGLLRATQKDNLSNNLRGLVGQVLEMGSRQARARLLPPVFLGLTGWQILFNSLADQFKFTSFLLMY